MTKKGIIILTVIFVGLAFIFGSNIYITYYHRKIKTLPKKYVYQTYFGPANSVLIIENLKYKNNLINYYRAIERNPDSNPPIGVPLKTVPQNDAVYVVGFTDDSLLAKVISYYNYGAFRGGSFTKGWVYYKCLHNSPPN
jgi:hypothetical protein